MGCLGREIKRQQSSSLWQKCTNLRTLKQIQALIIINGFNSNLEALRELIFCSAMVIPGAINYAHQLFAQITEPDTFMYNTMIRCSARSQDPLNGILLYTQMEKSCVKPNKFTFSFVLKACTRLLYRNMGFCVHGKVIKHGFEFNRFVRNTLIYFHANCGDLDAASVLFDGNAKMDVVAWSALTAGYARRGELSVARSLFDEMPVKDLVSWNVMITGYVKQREMEKARDLFNEVPKRDVVTWNAMISGYVLCGMHKQALEMFEEMRNVGERPDDVTTVEFVICLCGIGERAMEVFCGMKEKDVSTWSSVIGGLAFHGYAEESITLFREMQRLKFRPSEITFVGVLVACSHAGRVEEGKRYFQLMKDEYNIEPNIRHYGCMVDLLARAGLLNEAFEFVGRMEIEPNAIIWRTLLGACRIHGNIEFGKRANERLLDMRKDESGDYVLLSNIYASQGEWDGVEKVRKLMDDSGVRKEPGCSLIEADDKALMQYLLNLTHKQNSRNPDS
ncbi:Pentatricopeptide repeat-containing protein [Melia azedarach]|uniref:Pentatricopeptide repeat-containing protein n=1 Tax=Melia azedarach TaxID=155640 RepID=A0ACC1X9U2_MELAZ|nr:Pentatricopeptide repeat-containing protein [Melia azedarach]